MNKIVAYIIFLAAFFGITTNAQSQVMVICAGTDSIKLKAGNYHYGTVEWEQSMDNLNWTKISGALDTVYQFLPSDTRYYRAVNKFSNCPPEYSHVSKVQILPIANAGGDRTIPDTSVVLMGFLEEGATGAWSVFSGTEGSFSSTSSPSATFQGSDSLYTLVWTVSNDCGTSSDTVNIQFRNNTYIETLVVVDTTDVILSDSAQMAAGQYIIVFSTPVPSIGDSTILIGLIGEGFLRKVISFTTNGDTISMQTEQARLEDITINGAFDMAQVFSIDSVISGSKTSNQQRLDHMPTRAELLDPKFKNGTYYYLPQSEPAYHLPGVEIKKQSSKNAGSAINLQFNNVILIDSGLVNLSLSGGYSFTPNLQADLGYSGLNLETFRFGMYNATLEQNLNLGISLTLSDSLLNDTFTLYQYNHNIVFVIGAVPVWIQVQFKVKGQVSIVTSASLNFSHEISKTTVFTAAVEYENGTWSYPYSKNEGVTETENSFSINGSLNQNFKLGPSLNFKIYGIVGPYIDFGVNENFGFCTSNDNWKANMDASLFLKVGAKSQIITENPLFTLNFTLFDIYKTWSWMFFNFEFPYSLEMISGNNQSYNVGSFLPQPVKVKVISNKGFSLPYAMVHFIPQNGGSVGSSLVIADANGFAQTTWTPGSSGVNTLEAYALDCDGNYIDNSPLVFTAYPDNACANSSLSAHVIVNGNTIAPAGIMGVPPYQYSTDGLNFSNSAPVLTVTPGITYLFFVKDGDDCLASANYFAPNPCVNSGLSLNLSIMGNTITATGAGGAGPYQYALDASSGSYSSSNIFTNVSQGSHTAYVQDANGCTASSVAQVTSVPGFSCGTSTITDYDGNTYNTVQIGNQCWMRENLNVTHYANGTNVNGVYVYDSNESNAAVYGRLYTWNAVMNSASSSNNNPSGIQGACPNGWHVPSDAEWQQMEMFLGMSLSEVNVFGFTGTNEGGKLKEIGTTHWFIPNTGANNLSGFTALPGGNRLINGTFSNLYGYGRWWTSTSYNSSLAIEHQLGYSFAYIKRYYYEMNHGFSLRCLRDVSIQVSLPTITTSNITSITQTTAYCGGEVTLNGGSYITEYGICWNTSGNPTLSDCHTLDGEGLGAFSSNITGLNSGTAYYVRAYATNSVGTAYGNQVSFTTINWGSSCAGTPTVTDYDGNVYNTIQIGTQCWMRENLATTHYADGTALVDGTSAGDIYGNYTTKYWFVYNNNMSYKATYGLLYTWAAVMNGAGSSNNSPSGVQGVCPTGWHVPSNAEWTSLTNYLGGSSIAGGKLKETGTTHWNSPNIGATNESGFTALPGGDRLDFGTFFNVGLAGIWWTSTECDATNVWYYHLYYGNSEIGYNGYFKALGFSMRCLRNY